MRLCQKQIPFGPWHEPWTPLVIAVDKAQEALIRFVIKKYINNDPNKLLALLPWPLARAIRFKKEKIANIIIREIKKNPKLLRRILQLPHSIFGNPIFHDLVYNLTPKKFFKTLEITRMAK
jgi:hypothetical protein